MIHIIGGKHKKRTLLTPKSTHVRPTSSQLREAVFNICQHEIQGARFLDLFAGSGAMGLEALSRGALHATFVDKQRTALETIKRNIVALEEESQTTVIAGDVLTILPRLQKSFEIIYVDPPYGKGLGQRVLTLLDQSTLLAPNGILFIEDTSLEEPDLTYLVLQQKRRFGHSSLFRYSRIDIVV